MAKLPQVRDNHNDLAPSKSVQHITSAEELDSAIALANAGDSEVNRHLLEQLISELSAGIVSPDLGRWFSAKLRPVIDGQNQFDLAFHVRKKPGRQKGTVGYSDEFIALGVSILQITEPGITWSAIHETLAASLYRSPERIKDVVNRCRKENIFYAGSTLEDLNSFEGFDEWKLRLGFYYQNKASSD